MTLPNRFLNIVVVLCLGTALFWFPTAAPARNAPPEERPGKLDKNFNQCKPGETELCDGLLTQPIPSEQTQAFGHAMAVQKEGQNAPRRPKKNWNIGRSDACFFGPWMALLGVCLDYFTKVNARRAGESVLDVAIGTGNAALAAPGPS